MSRRLVEVTYTFAFRIICPTCGAPQLHAGLSQAEEPLVYCTRCHGRWWLTFSAGATRTLVDLVASVGQLFESLCSLCEPEGEPILREVRDRPAPLRLGDAGGAG